SEDGPDNGPGRELQIKAPCYVLEVNQLNKEINMKKMPKWLAAGFLFSGLAAAVDDVAWLEFCDSCASPGAFEFAALRVPSINSTVFVLNRKTGEVHKYAREIDREDGFMIWVVEVQMNDIEIQAFADDFALASVQTLPPIGRRELGDFQADIFPLGPADTVIDDLSDGAIRGAFAAKFNDFIEAGNFFPTVVRLGTQINFGLSGDAFGVGENKAYYPSTKTFRIDYPDGAKLWIVVGIGLKWIQVWAEDINGQEITLDVRDSEFGADINPASFEGRELDFGPGNDQALLDLLRKLGQRPPGGGGGGLSCSSMTLPDGAVRITCPNLN
ncbi:MAG: hypothetical protein RQ741_08940, partial [Wenzhouxiangellaceae bacterium]|nr:hypothetical protein [Wenzhouxiangellaceae bacterium]